MEDNNSAPVAVPSIHSQKSISSKKWRKRQSPKPLRMTNRKLNRPRLGNMKEMRLEALRQMTSQGKDVADWGVEGNKPYRQIRAVLLWPYLKRSLTFRCPAKPLSMKCNGSFIFSLSAKYVSQMKHSTVPLHLSRNMFNLAQSPLLTCQLVKRFSQAIFILSHLVRFASADGPVTIESLTAYSVQRLCVQECIWFGLPGGGPGLPGILSCAQPYSDSCMCRTDLTASAISYLSTCVNSLCSSNTVDVSNAVSLYTGYCNSDLSMIAFAPSVTIESSGEYSSLRQCAQQCIWGGTDGGGPPLPQAISCNDNLNGCMCRADLSPSASSFLTTCIDSNCSGDQDDLSSAIAAYTVYCNAAFATTTGAAARSSTSSASPSPSSSQCSSLFTCSLVYLIPYHPFIIRYILG
jgi:hypothetical protein